MAIRPRSVAMEPLTPADAQVVQQVVMARPRGLWARFRHALSEAVGVLSREEFDRAAEIIRASLDGQPIDHRDAATKARRLMEAHTGAYTETAVAKCQFSDTAILVIHHGGPDPRKGFYYSKALKLKDPSRG